MNILIVGPHAYKVKGGISTVLRNYYEGILNENNRLIPINTVIDGKKSKKIFWCIYSYFKMIVYLTFTKVDIVHVHTASGKSFYRKSLFISTANIYKKKIILHMHGGRFDDFYWKDSNQMCRRYITNILNSCDLIIALGEEWREKIQKYCSTPIKIIYNSVETYNENYYNIESNNILFLGRLEREKGIYELLDVAKEIIDKNNNVKFILAGDGDLDIIKKYINKFNISENIILPGWVSKEHVKKLLMDSMIFVLPSYNEGLPMSILEAMALGVPIVATNVGSIEEVVKNDVNGKIINPKSRKELKEALMVLIDDKKMRRSYSNNNYKEINVRFSNKINLSKLDGIYKDINKM